MSSFQQADPENGRTQNGLKSDLKDCRFVQAGGPGKIGIPVTWNGVLYSNFSDSEIPRWEDAAADEILFCQFKVEVYRMEITNKQRVTFKVGLPDIPAYQSKMYWGVSDFAFVICNIFLELYGELWNKQCLCEILMKYDLILAKYKI